MSLSIHDFGRSLARQSSEQLVTSGVIGRADYRWPGFRIAVPWQTQTQAQPMKFLNSLRQVIIAAAVSVCLGANSSRAADSTIAWGNNYNLQAEVPGNVTNVVA